MPNPKEAWQNNLDNWLARLITRLVVYGIRLVTRFFCKVEVNGRENIPHDGRTLFLLRHRSFLGIFLLEEVMFYPWALENMVMFPMNVVKEKYVNLFEQLWIVGRIFQWLTMQFNILSLPEKTMTINGKRSAIVQAEIDALTIGKNCSLVLYPTGTRDEFGEMGLPPVMSGVGRVVAGARPRIIFVWDQDTAEFWPKGRKLPKLPIHWLWGFIPIYRRFRVTVTISKPIEADDSDTMLYRVCDMVPLDKSGWPVAGYLHDLWWAWAVIQHSELEKVEEVNPDVQGDLWKLT